MDIFDSEKRSKIMSQIKSKNTKPELVVFKYLRGKKIYFQKHYDRVQGKPDVALPRKKRAVFIHGDFWHGRTLEKIISRRGLDDFWSVKIAKNVERDRRQQAELLAQGWTVLTVWETELMKKSTRDETLLKIENFLKE